MQTYTCRAFPGTVMGELSLSPPALSLIVKKVLGEDKDRGEKDKYFVEGIFYHKKF